MPVTSLGRAVCGAQLAREFFWCWQLCIVACLVLSDVTRRQSFKTFALLSNVDDLCRKYGDGSVGEVEQCRPTVQFSRSASWQIYLVRVVPREIVRPVL